MADPAVELGVGRRGTRDLSEVDGYYWMYRDGFWHRSDHYADGFVRVTAAIVPPLVIRVHRPHVYVRYRARRGVRVRVIERPRGRRRVYRR